MANRQLHVILISANLVDVSFFGRMEVYAIASLSNDPGSKKRTPVDRDHGNNPVWNFEMTFFIPNKNPDVLYLHIQLKSKRILRNSDVGEAAIPISIKEILLEGPGRVETCNVKKPSGKQKGRLNFSYHIGNEVIGYPAPVAGSNAYPPPPPADGYEAPQSQPVYVYVCPPPAAAVKPKKNLLGKGLGLIGETISNVFDFAGGEAEEESFGEGIESGAVAGFVFGG